MCHNNNNIGSGARMPRFRVSIKCTIPVNFAPAWVVRRCAAPSAMKKWIVSPQSAHWTRCRHLSQSRLLLLPFRMNVTECSLWLWFTAKNYNYRVLEVGPNVPAISFALFHPRGRWSYHLFWLTFSCARSFANMSIWPNYFDVVLSRRESRDVVVSGGYLL